MRNWVVKIILFWNRKTKRQKMLSIVLFVFAVLLLMVFIFRNTITFNLSENLNLPSNFPKENGVLWKPIKWQERLIAYPPTWTPKPYASISGDGQIDYIRFYPPSVGDKAWGENDFITVGGDECSKLQISLCVGNEPIYTKSRDPNIMQIFNIMVKHKYKYDKYK